LHEAADTRRGLRFGAPVEWHQDWTFYPHTNDHLAAVDIMLDDVGEPDPW
jgi:hypothetical protein